MENRNNTCSNVKNNLSSNYIMAQRKSNIEKKNILERNNKKITDYFKPVQRSNAVAPERENNLTKEEVKEVENMNIQDMIEETKKMLDEVRYAKLNIRKVRREINKKYDDKKINRDVKNIKHVPLRKTKKYIRKDNKEKIKKLLKKVIQEKIKKI